MITEQSAATEVKIICLRRERRSWRDIGENLGLSHEHCRQLFNKAVSKYPAECLNVMRVEESELADEMICELRKMVLDPLAKYRDRIEGFKALLMWSESKRRLHGVDAPIRREIEIMDTTSMDAQLRAELAELENEHLAAEANKQ